MTKELHQEDTKHPQISVLHVFKTQLFITYIIICHISVYI